MATATVTQAYRFALGPTPEQRRLLASHVGAARKAFNSMLAEVNATLEARRWERRILGGCVTEAQGWSLPALRRTWGGGVRGVLPVFGLPLTLTIVGTTPPADPIAALGGTWP